MNRRQAWNWYVGCSRLDGVSKSIHEGSRARVSIRSYFFVDNRNISLGTYRQGQCARDSGKGKKKATKVKHSEQIEGVERQLAWGEPQQRCDVLYGGRGCLAHREGVGAWARGHWADLSHL